MPSSALAPVMYQLQESLNSFDLKQWISNVDFKTFGVLALVVVGVIFLLDLLTKSYAPFGKSLLYSAANAWDNREQLGLNDVGRGSRSLEPLTNVLDSLAEAVLKWEDSEGSTMKNRAL